MAVIGDEDSVTGLLLAGIGHVDRNQVSNFMVVGPGLYWPIVIHIFPSVNLFWWLVLSFVTQSLRESGGECR